MENPFTGYTQTKPKGTVPRKVDLDRPMENPFEGVEREGEPQPTSGRTVPRKPEMAVRKAQLPARKPEAQRQPRGAAKIIREERPTRKRLPKDAA